MAVIAKAVVCEHGKRRVRFTRLIVFSLWIAVKTADESELTHIGRLADVIEIKNLYGCMRKRTCAVVLFLLHVRFFGARLEDSVMIQTKSCHVHAVDELRRQLARSGCDYDNGSKTDMSFTVKFRQCQSL